MKSTITKIKNSLKIVKGRFEQAEESQQKLSRLSNRKKKIEEKKQRAYKGDYAMEESQRRRRGTKRGRENIYEIISENFPNLMKGRNINI